VLLTSRGYRWIDTNFNFLFEETLTDCRRQVRGTLGMVTSFWTQASWENTPSICLVYVQTGVIEIYLRLIHLLRSLPRVGSLAEPTPFRNLATT
jgi:hypothetical protein